MPDKNYAATTFGGTLQPIENCTITIPMQYVNELPNGDPNPKYEPYVITFFAMPTISDAKDAHYTDDAAMGRGSSITGYSYSRSRVISIDIPFIVTEPNDIIRNIAHLRTIEALVYPIDRVTSIGTFKPPPVCQIECGQLLANRPICAVLTKYNVKFEPNVPLDPATLLPYKFSIGTDWRVVYSSQDLPGFGKIFVDGY